MARRCFQVKQSAFIFYALPPTPKSRTLLVATIFLSFIDLLIQISVSLLLCTRHYSWVIHPFQLPAQCILVHCKGSIEKFIAEVKKEWPVSFRLQGSVRLRSDSVLVFAFYKWMQIQDCSSDVKNWPPNIHHLA